MRVLFLVDVSDSLDRIDAALIARDIAQMEMTAIRRVALYADPGEVASKATILRKADYACHLAQDDLAKLVHRYVRQYGWIEMLEVNIRKRIALRRQPDHNNGA